MVAEFAERQYPLELCAFFVIEFGARIFARITVKERSMVYDSVLGWKLVSNARKYHENEEEPYLISINSKGFRDKEFSYKKPSSAFRVIILGDSFVFGSGGVSEERIFTEILETNLKNVEVLNMGTPGYSLDQEFLLMKSEVFKYQPDIIILCLYVNDFDETFTSFNRSIGRPKGYVSIENGGDLKFYPPKVSFLYALSEQSYILGLVEHKFKIFSKPNSNSKTDQYLSIDYKKKAFEQLLIEMKELSEGQNAEFIAINFPARGQKKMNSIQEILKSVSIHGGLSFIDFMDWFHSKKSEQTLYFNKDIHLNSNGHKFVAKRLYEFLMERSKIKTFIKNEKL